MVRRRNRISRRRYRPRRMNKSAFTALSLRSPTVPRSSSQIIWSPYTLQRTVELADSTTASFTFAYIRESLLSILAISTTSALSVRLLSLEVYDLAGRPLSLTINDLVDSIGGIEAASGGTLRVAYDYPGRTSWAKVKICWPKTHSSVSQRLESGNTTNFASVSVGTPIGASLVSSKPSILYRLRLLWSSTGGTPSSLLASDEVKSGLLTIPADSSKELDNIQSP